MSNRSLQVMVLTLSLLACSVVSHAAPRGQSSELEMDPAACEALAGLPGSTMSVESCRTMMLMGEDDPSTYRPGDEAMTCEQIFAELAAMEGEGVSDATAAQNEAVIDAGRGLAATHGAEIARQMAPPPLAIVASLLPNAAAAPLLAADMARKQAAAMKLKGADQRYNAQVQQQMTVNTDELGTLIAANPRLPRLSQLAIEKDCELPQE